MRQLDLSDTPYRGTLSQIKLMPQSAKRTRGKVRGNKVDFPRSYTRALTPVTDQNGDVVKIARKRSGTFKRVVKVATPREVEASRDRNVRLLNMAGNNSDVD